ncbi:MAG: SulP family inorganic anion transporter [Saprospiraceae bacterium]|nr:SulP family inorganic anion transporter [Candidatus Brachybacter algidus]
MNKASFIKDLLAGLTVSFAALSLGAAFGAMSGRGAFAGMIGAAVIPIITSIFGGTRLQASGPTAPMTAVTALIVAHAYDVFPEKIFAEQFITLIFILFGVTIILAGVFRAGRLIQLVPNTVVLGFMNGIAVLIWYDQIAKLFGILGKKMIEGSLWLNLTIALATICLIFLIPYLIKKSGIKAQYHSFFSGLLFAILIMTILANLMGLDVQKVELGNTIESFSEYFAIISSYFPSSQIVTQQNLILALPYALELTMLCYLDSLLTALVVDKMTGEKTNQNKELMAQGLANGISGILQGIPGAQATIRSVLLIKENAQTRFAGIMLGLFVLISLVFFKDFITLIPAAVFAGVLVKAGWDVCDRDYVEAYFKNNWIKSINRNFQVLIIVYTTIITVVVDLNVAVITGTILYYIGVKLFKKYDLKDVEDQYEENID